MSSFYKFTYKRHLLKKQIKAVGHNWDKNSDRMDIYHQDGSITSLAKWSSYTLYLGTDWVLYTKKAMEKETGQSIKLTVDAEAS